MEKLQVYRNSSVEWKPSAVVALATSTDGTQVAAAREDGSLEIWLVSPGSVGWHCQLTIHGDPSSRVSSLVWCRSSLKCEGPGRLLSSSIDGSISEWDLFALQQKVILDSVGVSIWQMAIEPFDDLLHSIETDSRVMANGYTDPDTHSDSESSKTDDDEGSDELHTVTSGSQNQRIAIACDDGCLRIYNISDTDEINYNRSFPRVSGRMLSVVWSLDAKRIFSGSSDGSGTLVSGDSSGSVQFWDSQYGTLLQAHTYHKGDVHALATVPSNSRVFSAGSDGQVILYKLSNGSNDSLEDKLPTERVNKWVYVGYLRAHTHDIRALTVAVPISSEDSLPDEKVSKFRRKEKPISFTYHKWAHLGVPMLISAGDDTKLFAYSASEFTQFSPHDICPAPQRVFVQLVLNSVIDGAKVILVQYSSWLDVLLVKLDSDKTPKMPSRKSSTTQLLARFKSKGARKINCSTISTNGLLLAYSDHVKPSLFELRRPKVGKCAWSVNKVKLPQGLPNAHCMAFSSDCSRLMLAGHDKKICVVDVKRSELLHTFVPRRKEEDMNCPPSEPPITKMFASSDGQWLAAINCYGDIYFFNMEIDRQHWFISRLNGASVTAGGFPPGNSNVLVITTSSNQVYIFDVEAKQLGEWSRRHTFIMPRRFQEFPGEVIGLSFPPSLNSTSVIVYSTSAMCLIDFGMPIEQDDDVLPNGSDLLLEHRDLSKFPKSKRKRRDLYHESKPNKRKNFDFCAFRDPVLFVGHLSESSLFVIEKRWMDVAQSFDAPVHRHIYGT